MQSLKLHGPRGDVEHGRVKALASEGRAFSVPALLQHLMDFLQTENRQVSRAANRHAQAGPAVHPPLEVHRRVTTDTPMHQHSACHQPYTGHPHGSAAVPSHRICPKPQGANVLQGRKAPNDPGWWGQSHGVSHPSKQPVWITQPPRAAGSLACRTLCQSVALPTCWLGTMRTTSPSF